MNKIFEKSDKDILLNPDTWDLIASCIEIDTRPLVDFAHSKWRKDYLDKHEVREIMLVLEGECIFSFDSQIYPCKPGTLMVFDSFEEHDFNYPAKVSGVRHLWITLIEYDILCRVLCVNNGRVVEAGRESSILSNPELIVLFHKSLDELGSNLGSPEFLKRAKLKSILSALMTYVFEQDFSGERPKSKVKNQQEIILSIKHHIENTAGKGLCIDNLAKISGYSKYHFFRLFKKHTGMTVHQYIDQARLKKANQMLKEGHLKKEIADELGFSSPVAFSHWYRKFKINS